MSFANIATDWRRNFAQIVLGLKVAMAYKFDFLIGLITTPISLFIFYFLWKAIYVFSGTAIIRGYSFDMLINYFVLSMFVGFFAWSNIDDWMEYAIIHGDLISDLIRPMSFIKQEFFFELGLKTMALIVQAIPLVIGAQLLLGLMFVSVGTTLLAILSLALASAMFFLISYLIGMGAFWLKRIGGLRRMKRGLILFLSGGMIPIAFFPTWFITLSHYLPFEYIRYVPINVYMGQYTFSATGFGNLFVVLGAQLLWVILLFIAAQLMWKGAFKKFAGAGA
ncbi:ABC transporter permease [Thermoproteota archaeon]